MPRTSNVTFQPIDVRRALAAMVAAVGCMASAVRADPPAAPPTTAPAQTPPPAADKQPPTSDEPSLDEALGIGGVKKPADAPGKEDLDRNLSDTKPRDLLGAALDDMKKSASLLDGKESGLPTQRAQQSAVRKLDELIAAAQRMRQQQQQQQSGQSSQQQQQQQGKDGKQQSKEGKDQKEGQQGEQPKPEAGNTPQDGQRGKQQGDANANEPSAAMDPTKDLAQLDETRAEWGRLPARVREAVRQGMRDPMSAAYRKLTEEYYRRMAEEPKR